MVPEAAPHMQVDAVLSLCCGTEGAIFFAVVYDLLPNALPGGAEHADQSAGHHGQHVLQQFDQSRKYFQCIVFIVCIFSVCVCFLCIFYVEKHL